MNFPSVILILFPEKIKKKFSFIQIIGGKIFHKKDRFFK